MGKEILGPPTPLGLAAGQGDHRWESVCFELGGRKVLYKPRRLLSDGGLDKGRLWSEGPRAVFGLTSRGHCGEAKLGSELEPLVPPRIGPRLHSAECRDMVMDE